MASSLPASTIIAFIIITISTITSSPGFSVCYFIWILFGIALGIPVRLLIVPRLEDILDDCRLTLLAGSIDRCWVEL